MLALRWLHKNGAQSKNRRIGQRHLDYGLLKLIPVKSPLKRNAAFLQHLSKMKCCIQVTTTSTYRKGLNYSNSLLGMDNYFRCVGKNA